VGWALLQAAWAKDLDAVLGAWGTVTTFAGIGLVAAILASWKQGGALLRPQLK